MHPADLIQHYGYGAVVVGTCFEGEIVMLLAGVAACAGYLSLPGVIAAGMTGIFCSDTFCFALGWIAGERLARWFPGLHARMGGVLRLIARHDKKAVVLFQFFPGMCAITPLALGLTRMPVARFLGLDLVGNALWTGVYSTLGYFGGAAVVCAVAGLSPWATAAAALLLAGVAGTAVWGWRKVTGSIGRPDGASLARP